MKHTTAELVTGVAVRQRGKAKWVTEVKPANQQM
jgi:hypothetical protein